MENKFATPVLFIIFNRPDTTQVVFDEIKKIKPTKLFVVADGPRAHKEGEKEKCDQARNIINQVDWDCEIVKNFSDTNIGCGKRVSSGITWFFENVEKGIILEDDCVPSQSFFHFCGELLDTYEHDERIMMISGTNVLGSWMADRQDYHFSYYGGIWGWATWKRAWDLYDFSMKGWDRDDIKDLVHYVLMNKREAKSRIKNYEDVYRGKIDTWDYQWSFSRLVHSGLSIVPSKNLISNIGFNRSATHTKTSSLLENLPLNDLLFPLRGPTFMVVDRKYDSAFYKVLVRENFVLRKIYKKLISLLC